MILRPCDACPGPQTFDLHVSDCWRGLARAKAEGLVDFGADGFDLEEYEELDEPSNADLHEVVKGKFIAMRGPIPPARARVRPRARRCGGVRQ